MTYWCRRIVTVYHECMCVWFYGPLLLLLQSSCSYTACGASMEISQRVAAANSGLQQLRQATIWFSRALTLSDMMQCIQYIVMSVLLNSREAWAVVKALWLLCRWTA